MEKKKEKKPAYLDLNESESVASSIQEEAYQRIKMKYATIGSASSQEVDLQKSQSTIQEYNASQQDVSA